MSKNMKTLLYLGPILITALMMIWMVIVSPYAGFHDRWAIYPVFFLLPLVFFYHVALMIKGGQRSLLMAYGVLHILFFFYLWLFALAKISKDSL